MGLMALKQEFEGAVAELPQVPVFVANPSKDDRDPVGEFNHALRIFQRQIATWRARALISVEKFREIFDQAASEDDRHVDYLLSDLMPQVMEALDDLEAKIQSSIDSSPLKQKSGSLAAVSAPLARVAKTMDKKATAAFNVQLGYIKDIRGRLFDIIDEYDPENKPVGDVLRAGDDFDAWFGRIVAAE